MNVRVVLVEYAIAVVVFLAVDLVWLTVVAQPVYDALLGDLLAEQPVVAAAAVFYALFVAGLVLFVIGPAVQAGSPRRAAALGAAFGLVTYATWDLTSLAVIRDFPAALVPIDLAWGAVLAAVVSTTTTALTLRWLGDAGATRTGEA